MLNLSEEKQKLIKPLAIKTQSLELKLPIKGGSGKLGCYFPSKIQLKLDRWSLDSSHELVIKPLTHSLTSLESIGLSWFIDGMSGKLVFFIIEFGSIYKNSNTTEHRSSKTE